MTVKEEISVSLDRWLCTDEPEDVIRIIADRIRWSTCTDEGHAEYDRRFHAIEKGKIAKARVTVTIEFI